MGTVAGPIIILPVKSITSYAFTPRDTMTETLNDTIDTTPPKKRAAKLKEETPVKDSYAGSKSTEVHVRDSIEFIRPGSSRRNKTQSSVFDFTPPKHKPRRVAFGISSQRYSRSPYATHDIISNGVDKHDYRPTTPFAQHYHVTDEQVFSPRRQRTFTPIPKTPTPEKVFKRPPPGGHCHNIFG